MLDGLTFKILIKKTAIQDSLEHNLISSVNKRNISHIFDDFNPSRVLNVLRREKSRLSSTHYCEINFIDIVKDKFKVWTQEDLAIGTFKKNKEFMRAKSVELGLSYQKTIELYFATSMHYSNIEPRDIELIHCNDTLYSGSELCKYLSVVLSDMPSTSSNTITTGDLFFTFTKHLSEYNMELDGNMNAFKYSSHSNNLEHIFKNLNLIENLRRKAHFSNDAEAYNLYDLAILKDVILLDQYGRFEDLKKFLYKLDKYETESLGYFNFKESNIKAQLFDTATTEILQYFDTFNLEQLTKFITYQYYNYSKGYLTKHSWLQFVQPAKPILNHFKRTEIVINAFNSMAGKLKSDENISLEGFFEEISERDIRNYPSFIKYYIEDLHCLDDYYMMESMRKYLIDHNININPYFLAK